MKVAKKYGLDKYVKYRDSNPRCLYSTESKSRIFAAGTADVENIKSKCDMTGYWFEEFTQSNFDDYLTINSQFRVNSPVPSLKIGTFNPISKTNWIKTKIFDESKIEPEIGKLTDWKVEITLDDGTTVTQNFAALRVNYLHNIKHLKPSVIADLELLKKRSPRLYKVLVQGEWGDLDEGFFFKMDFLRKWNALPADGFNYIYCDPNLAIIPFRHKFNTKIFFYICNSQSINYQQ
jgi:phage terminase large subunit